MTREIKFRAWHETDKCWYNPRFIEMNLLGQAIIHHGLEQFEIIPASAIEQYTGLKDKNGKEIYEGDIVEFGLSGRAEQGYVAYADEYASFEVYSKRDFIFGCLFGHAGKVIGNIHENPELLEVKNELR